MVLVDDILDLAKFDSNRFLLNISKFKLREVIEEINYIFKFQWDEKHLAFNILWDPEVVDSYFCSDSKRIKQVLINLISNSFKFTENGGIRIEISDYVHHRKKYLKFSVTDTGIGIHKDDIPKLFAMFGMIRKNNSSQLNKWGSGIGLWISKKIVESLGGKITWESEDGKWTWFTFSIKNMPELVKEEHHSAQVFINSLDIIKQTLWWIKNLTLAI